MRAPAPTPSFQTPAYAERPAAPPAPRYAEPAAYAPPAAPAPESAQAAFEAPKEVQAELYAAPAPAPEPVRAAEPQIQRPITRIVDPAVEEAEEEPLFGETAFEDRRPQRGGFLSLFGSRPRYDAPAAAPAPRPTASRGGALPAEQPMTQQEPQGDAQEDLEIPSFLRRLAN
jgi:cell division protein FtsZ